MAKKPPPKKPTRRKKLETPPDASGAASPVPAWHAHLTRCRTFVEPATESAPAPVEETAKAIPADTIRRLKFPVIETVHPDGSRSFKHDRCIVDDARIATGSRVL